MKRLTALLIALLAMTMILTACSGDSAQNNDTTAPTPTAAPETEPPVTDLEIVKDGTANYTVIRSETASQSVIDAATLVRKLIGDQTGAFPDISTDWVKRGAEIPTDTAEIVIGDTNRRASAGMRRDDWTIEREGSRIYILGGSGESLQAAVEFRLSKRTEL